MTLEQQIAELHLQAKSLAFGFYLRRGRVPCALNKIMEETSSMKILLDDLKYYKAERERVPAGSFDGGEWAPGGGNKHPQAGSSAEDAAAIEARLKDTLAPNGTLIGRAGSRSTIRELPGGKQAAEKMFSDLSKGGVESTPPNLAARGGIRYTTPDGSHITYRGSSKSGPPTLDFGGNHPLRGIVDKLKYPDEVE